MSDELDPALRALLDAERSAPIAGAAEAKAQIFAAVSGAGGAAAGAASAASAWSTKALLLVALSAGGVGALLGSVVTSTLTQPVAAPTLEVSVPEPALETTRDDEVEQVLAPEVEPEVTPLVPTEAPRDVPRRERAETEMAHAEVEVEAEVEPSTLAAERALIDQALSALRANSAQNALVALMSHERRFAGGALAEERDRLSVDALVQLGRTDQARRRAQLFEARYPSSAHLQRVRSLVE